MQAVAGLAGLSDAEEDLPIAALGEPPQQLRAQIVSRAGAVTVGIDIDTGLSRPSGSSPAASVDAHTQSQ